MSLHKRSKIWHVRLYWQGREIRRNTGTPNKRVASEIERKIREDLALGRFGLEAPAKPERFDAAGARWLSSRTGLSARTVSDYEGLLDGLSPEIADRLVTHISAADVAKIQKKRAARGVGPRRINYEIRIIRQVLTHFGEWRRIRDQVDWLVEPRDVGCAISESDEARLLGALRQTGSPALYSLVVSSLDTGLRCSELRKLRHRDLGLEWAGGVIVKAGHTVSKSKTAAGTGRFIPLTERARGALSIWLSRPELPKPLPLHFVFPRHVVIGAGAEPRIEDVEPEKPIGDWKTAWRSALRRADLKVRWHDLRHTFITRLAENPNVSEETIRSLAGHVSRKMLERYSHVRNRAKEQAIAALEQSSRRGRPAQEPAQIYLRERDGEEENPATPRIH